MALINYILKFIILTNFLQSVVGETPKFRILAPEFICPKDEDSHIDKPDKTVITLQTNDLDLQVSWTVRWTPLTAPAQRFTLLLWKAIRALEAKLNGPQPEPFVYVIDNAELLGGVNYIFNVTELKPKGDIETSQSFHIDNLKGDQKLLIEGRTDKFSIILIGGQTVFTDQEYVVEADVTTCPVSQDYYFVWSIHNSADTDCSVNIKESKGSRLEVPPYSLRAGRTYYVNCQIFRHSNDEFITQTGLPFEVLYRGLEVNLNVDVLVVPINSLFTVESIVVNHDYFDEVPSCINEGQPCDIFESVDRDALTVLSGLPNTGRFEIIFSVSIRNQIATANCTVIAVEQNLPIIQVYPVPRILNEDTTISLVANTTRLAPTCKLTWYFATEEYLASSMGSNSTCDECEHGEALSELLTIFSLEDNFLNELSDFSNETEWRLVITEIQAASGRARFVVTCDCSLTLSCESEGTVYADISFQINNSPKAGEVLISPDNGIALETVFRISTLPVMDLDRPLRYTFLCRIGINDTLILSSNIEHLAIDTFLPYIEGGTEVWVEVCDARGACGNEEVRTIQLSASKGRTIDALINGIRAYIKRCDLMPLQRLAVCAIVSYNNSCEPELLLKFTKALIESLSASNGRCIKSNTQYYLKFLQWLSNAGIDTRSLIK